MQLKKVDETTYQVLDLEGVNVLFTGDMKACDDFMLQEIKKKIEADPEWFINQMNTLVEKLKVIKKTIETNFNNDNKNDTNGKSSS